MKRIIAILLFACYLMPCMGLSVSAHYCGGKIASFSILSTKHAKCPCNKKTMKKGCCHDKISMLKIAEHQKVPVSISHPPIKIDKSAVFAFVPYKMCFNSNYIERHIPVVHPPPLQRDIALFLFHRTLLI